MKCNEKKQITDIVNAFRLINKDIKESFNSMCKYLESKNNFNKWKKWEKANKYAKEDYRDYYNLIDGDNWYYLNCYGLYNHKVIGFTFVISINYEENEDIAYSKFIKQLDTAINLNTPMLCIFGIYTPIDETKILLVDENDSLYVDDILHFTGSQINYEQKNISYNKWFDIEVECFKNGELKEGYEGWYKNAKLNIYHITDISSKESTLRLIDNLIAKTQELV